MTSLVVLVLAQTFVELKASGAGRVVSYEKPVAGAVVRVFPQDDLEVLLRCTPTEDVCPEACPVDALAGTRPPKGARSEVVTTDASGRFSLKAGRVVPGATIVVNDPERGVARTRAEEGQLIFLDPEPVHIRVVDEALEPVLRAKLSLFDPVTLAQTNLEVSQGGVDVTIASAWGEVTAPGFLATSRWLSAPVDGVITLVLVRPRTLTLSTKLGGRPVSTDVRVAGCPLAAHTDARGKLVLKDVRPGQVEVLARAGSAGSRAAVAVDASATALALDLEPFSTVDLQVVDDERKPMRAVQVFVSGLEVFVAGQELFTDDRGHLTLELPALQHEVNLLPDNADSVGKMNLELKPAPGVSRRTIVFKGDGGERSRIGVHARRLGSANASALEAKLKAQRPSWRYCFEAELQFTPSTSKSVIRARVGFDAAGEVTSAALIDSTAPRPGACALKRLQQLTVSKPPVGEAEVELEFSVQ